jgi:hypothetical protein
MPELALDDVERHALARELDGIRVPELVWREPAPHACADGQPAQLRADCGSRPSPPSRGSVDDAKQRPDRQLRPRDEPGAQQLPAPLVHADLAPAAALAAPDQQRSAPLVEVVLGKRESLLDTSPARQSTMIIARILKPWRSSGVWRSTATISSTVGGSAG